MSDKVLELDDSNFDEKVRGGVALVDFWAPWCGPCKMQGPVIEDLAEKVGNDVKIAKLNVDEAPETAARFGVSSIPTLAVFKDGVPVKTLIGVHNKDQLLAAIDAAK